MSNEGDKVGVDSFIHEVDWSAFETPYCTGVETICNDCQLPIEKRGQKDESGNFFKHCPRKAVC